MITQEEIEDLDIRFTYHPPTTKEKVDKYRNLRELARELAEVITDNQKNSRERSLALTRLEECIMWANAGIARNT